MALTLDFICSHEGMTTADLVLGPLRYTAGSGGTITTTNVRTGARAMQLVSNNNQTKSGLTNQGVRYLAFSHYPLAIPGSGARALMVKFQDAGTDQWGLYVNGDGTIAAYRGPSLTTTGGGTLIGSASAVCIAGLVQHDIVIATKFASTGGAIEVWVNGVQRLTLTSQDTTGSANDYANAWAFFGPSAMNGVIDNVISGYDSGTSIDSAVVTQLKKAKVIGQIAEAGNGTNAQSTPSSGTDRGAMVDETTGSDGDSTYNTFSTVGHIDTYNFPAVGESGVVLAVQDLVVARKTDVNPRDISLVERISGVNYDVSSAAALSETYQAHGAVRQTSPATAAAYTISELDALEMGPKLAA